MTISLAINRHVLAVAAAAAFVIGAPAFGAAPRPVLDSPFFPYTYRRMPNNEAKLAELGYSPFGNMFVQIMLTQEPPYPADLEERIRKAAAATKGGGVLWLAITLDKADLTASEAKAIEHVRKLAATAKAAGWQTSILPALRRHHLHRPPGAALRQEDRRPGDRVDAQPRPRTAQRSGR